MASNFGLTARVSRLACLIVACLLSWTDAGRAGLVEPSDTVLTIPEKVALLDDDCGDEKAPRPFERTFHATYRWNAQRRTFVTTSSNLEKLAKENDYLNSGDLPLPSPR